MQHPDAGCEVLLHEMMPASDSTKPHYTRLWLHVTGIEALCESIRAKGYDVTAPALTDYGATVAEMTGPDGYTLKFQEWKRVAQR